MRQVPLRHRGRYHMGTELLPGARVACQGWTVHCDARDQRFVSRGTPIFGPLPFRGDEMKNLCGLYI